MSVPIPSRPFSLAPMSSTRRCKASNPWMCKIFNSRSIRPKGLIDLELNILHIHGFEALHLRVDDIGAREKGREGKGTYIVRGLSGFDCSAQVRNGDLGDRK